MMSEAEFEALRKLLIKIRRLDLLMYQELSVGGITAADELYEDLTRRRRRVKYKENQT